MVKAPPSVPEPKPLPHSLKAYKAHDTYTPSRESHELYVQSWKNWQCDWEKVKGTNPGSDDPKLRPHMNARDKFFKIELARKDSALPADEKPPKMCSLYAASEKLLARLIPAAQYMQHCCIY